MAKDEKTPVSTKLDPDLLAKFEALCTKEMRSQASMLRVLIQRAVGMPGETDAQEDS